MSDREETEDNDESRVTKLIVTIVVLIVAFIVSLVVAKLVDICYDRRAIRDDASDISDNTRNLIRARLSVIQFKKRAKRKPDGEKEQKAVKHSAIMDFFRRWAQKVRDRRKTREISIKSQTPSSDDNVIITVDKDELTNDPSTLNSNNNSATRSPRLPLFSGGRTPSGSSQKTQNSIFATRPVSGKNSQIPSPFANSVGRNSVISIDRSTRPVSGTSINDKIRPVSSKPRDLPNVTRVEVDNNPKVHVKSVHFEDTKVPDTSDKKTEPEVNKPEPETVVQKTEVVSIGNVDT